MASKKAGDKANMDDKPVKVDKWDGNAVKNALDDAAKKVLISDLGYEESHGLMDGRLLICTISVTFAMYALIWDYFHPFPESRPVLIVCVISYFLMMGVLSIYTTFKERGIFTVALEKDAARLDPDNTWTLASTLKRYDDMYTLHMSYTDGETKQERKAEFTKSVADFFDENGSICTFQFDPEVVKLHDSLNKEKKSQ